MNISFALVVLKSNSPTNSTKDSAKHMLRKCDMRAVGRMQPKCKTPHFFTPHCSSSVEFEIIIWAGFCMQIAKTLKSTFYWRYVIYRPSIRTVASGVVGVVVVGVCYRSQMTTTKCTCVRNFG